jgi:molecular chaperone HtpG
MLVAEAQHLTYKQLRKKIRSTTSPIISHLIQKLKETKDITFVRVDSDHIDNLIKKDETTISNCLMKSKLALKQF